MSSFLDFVDRLECVPPLTRAQRALAGFAFDGAITDHELVEQIFGHTTPRRSSVVAILKGARAGGSTLAGLRALHLAMTVPLPPAAPGSPPLVAFVGPTERHGRLVYDVARGVIEGTPRLLERVDRRGKNGEPNITIDELTIERPDGRPVRLAVLPAKPQGQALRGSTLAACVITEAAFVASLDDGRAVNMDEQIAAAMARVVPGSQLMLESSAWRSDGVFMTMVRKCRGNADAHELAALAPTPLMRAEHPEILELVDREMQERPESARVEYLCEPPDSTGSTSAFPLPLVESCITLDAPPPLDGHGARALGADHAHVHDSSALVACVRADGLIHVAHLAVIPSPSKPSEVATAFAATARDARAAIMTDGHQRPALAEHYSAAGVTIVAAPEGARGKADTYQRLRSLMAEGRVRLPHPDSSPAAKALHAQLAAVTCKPMAGGGWSFTSPRRGGNHGDLVSALVLAVWQLRDNERFRAFKSRGSSRDPRARISRSDH